MANQFRHGRYVEDSFRTNLMRVQNPGADSMDLQRVGSALLQIRSATHLMLGRWHGRSTLPVATQW